MIRTGIGLAAALALSACAMISESQCRSGDWRALGARDGERGFGPERMSEYAQICAPYGARPAQAEYAAGRQVGLARYCTPENGYQHGALGDAYLGVCPKESEAQFVAALTRGRVLRPFTPDLYAFYVAMDEGERALAAATTDAERARLRGRLMEQEWWIRHLMNRPGTFFLD